MVVLWLVAAVLVASAAPAWPAWRDWSPRRRRLHAGLAAAVALPMLAFALLFFEGLIDGATAPILTADVKWLVAAVGLLTIALSWAASRVAWTGHRPWLLLAVPLLLVLLEQSHAPGTSDRGDPRFAVAMAVALAGSASFPWAFAGAITHRLSGWQAQVGVLGALAAYVMYGSLVAAPGLILFGPAPATDTWAFHVEPADWDAGSGSDAGRPYEVSLWVPWAEHGPWASGLRYHAPEFVAVDGDGDLLHPPGSDLVIAGTGAITVTLSLDFYGPIGMQENNMLENISAAATMPVDLRVEHRSLSPYCSFASVWEGRIEGGVSAGEVDRARREATWLEATQTDGACS